MTVYILAMIMVANSGIFNITTDIKVETMVFVSAEQCLRNLKLNKERLSSKYDQIQGECLPKDLIIPKDSK